MSAFGDRIKIVRDALGLSQEDMGKLLGITGPAIAMYETGKRLPDYRILDKVIKVFHVKHWLLFEDIRKEVRTEEAETFNRPGT